MAVTVWWRRWLPDTLAGRILAPGAATLVALLGASLLLHAALLRRAAEHGAAEIAAHRIADAVVAVAAAAPVERPALARLLSGPDLEVAWGSDPTVPEGRGAPKPDLEHAGRLAEVALELRTAPGGLDAAHGILQYAVVSARLADGSWVNARVLAVSLLAADDTAFRVAVGVVALALLLAAAFASRIAAAPLAKLAHAVRGLPPDGEATLPAVGGPREVREVAEALEAATRRTRDLLRQRSLALGALSHDLMSPIARLKLRAHELPDVELQRRALADLAEMEGMVSDVLAYLRGGDGGGEPAIPVSVAALVQVVVDEFAEAGALIEERRLDDATVLARPVALKRTVRNLVENAVKYGREPWVEVLANRAEVIVRVGDQGPGLSPEDLARIFEPFFRGDRARAAGGGSGLGLPTARAIAETHGGALDISSAPDRGTEAVLRLPHAAGSRRPV
ncbi:sensor histidine kinase [Paeniroseomonas aquatica]|uniref:histidine kinase n=1 Tax=Paeniroseomonas aquatica TaxID=373043 RepID=A0ABT8A0E0_9PROT|nr:HAMP domain-containing sensor histidine kinase [Paeniroseomonas aquatica]MDN3562948.1 HAMP domain-containing sensor histidine kinase [Paeniroseomonas aquatica]